jgi:hypothetical protein
MRGQGREAKKTGTGLYPTAAFYARDEDMPNCEFYYDENTNMVVRAKHELQTNTVLTLHRHPVPLTQVHGGESLPSHHWLMDA